MTMAAQSRRGFPQPSKPEAPMDPRVFDLSPLHNDQTKPALILGDERHSIGAVLSISEAVDKEGNPLRGTLHPVRRGCEHWAPDAAETGDCRFRCGGSLVTT